MCIRDRPPHHPSPTHALSFCFLLLSFQLFNPKIGAGYRRRTNTSSSMHFFPHEQVITRAHRCAPRPCAPRRCAPRAAAWRVVVRGGSGVCTRRAMC
eukprot:2386140-Rhodomonas_salina.1